MLGTLARFTRQARRPLGRVAAAALVLPALTAPSLARGPDNIADVAEKVIDAVVNISTSQNVGARNNHHRAAATAQRSAIGRAVPRLLQPARRSGRPEPASRRRAGSIRSAPASSSTPAGIVVTNNHVIADADEITVILNDGTRSRPS